MRLTDSQVTNDYGLPHDFIGSSVVFRYQKTGGVVLCPECGRFLGTPKMQGGIIVPNQKEAKCPIHGCKGVLKCAQVNTATGSTTRVILTKLDGTKIKAKTVLHATDKFDKSEARANAMSNLVKKINAEQLVAA